MAKWSEVKSKSKTVFVNGYPIGTASNANRAQELFQSFITAIFGDSLRDGRSETAVRDGAVQIMETLMRRPALPRETEKSYFFTLELRPAWLELYR